VGVLSNNEMKHVPASHCCSASQRTSPDSIRPVGIWKGSLARVHESPTNANGPSHHFIDDGLTTCQFDSACASHIRRSER